MKTLDALKTGMVRSVKSWKGVLIVWFFYLLFVALLVLPLRSSLKSAFGNSMVTERFAGGFDIESFSDLEQTGRSLVSSISNGLFIALLFGIILNSFLSGGLFSILKADSAGFSGAEFFRMCGKYFWKFLFITLILNVIVLILGLIIVSAPVGLVMQSEPDSDKIAFITGIVSGTVFLLFLTLVVLIADYARAWNVAREEPACFRAIGFGITRTFERLRSSFMIAFIALLIQALLIFLALRFIGTWRPASGGGVLLLFIASQLLFIFRLFIKTFRYGSVTTLMEINNKI